MLTAPPVPGNRWDLLDGVWPRQPPTVSVIVVHYEQPAELLRTLRALDAQTYPPELREVIVVDDGSARAPDVPTDVTCLVQEHSGARPGAARNLGASHAGGDVLCFLDADTSPEPDYLRELCRLPALVPHAVTVGRRRHARFSALPPDATPAQGILAELPEPAWLREGYAATRNLLDADDRSYRFVISAVLGCSRGLFADIGGFADFDSYGGEDWEWAHRAWRAGALLAHVPEAVAWHDGPDWSDRDDWHGRRAVKNAEALRLASLIGVGGSRGHAVRSARAETVIRVLRPGGPAACFVCVDSLLETFPEAAVVLPPGAPGVFGGDGRVRPSADWSPAELAWPRIELLVHRPAEADGPELRRVCDEVLDNERARLRLIDEHGPLITISGTRARRRAERSGDAAALAGVLRSAGCVAALETEPDVEAWVGGWAPLRLPPPGRGSDEAPL